METLPKCLLLPIDDTEESLRPVELLSGLYPDKSAVNLLLSYFVPPLAPVYQETPESEAVAKKRRALLTTREEDTRRVLSAARKALVAAGFPEEVLQEHVEEKALSAAQHACRLADIRKVDAVLVQKRTSSSLEAFLRGDPSQALLHHCLVSPVWLTEGRIDPSHAAICIESQEACLRAVDHAGFMLSETQTRVTLLHIAHGMAAPISSPAFGMTSELDRWLDTREGRELRPFLEEVCGMLKREGFDDNRLQITHLPGKGQMASEILAYCREQGIGIVVLGHSGAEGGLSFLKSSLTRKVLADFRNMAVWVVQ